MKALGILRATSFSLALGVGLCVSASYVHAQDVGADVGGGAGIFRPKNPEAKKKPKTGNNTTKPNSRTTRPTNANVADRVEELLDN